MNINKSLFKLFFIGIFYMLLQGSDAVAAAASAAVGAGTPATISSRTLHIHNVDEVCVLQLTDDKGTPLAIPAIVFNPATIMAEEKSDTPEPSPVASPLATPGGSLRMKAEASQTEDVFITKLPFSLETTVYFQLFLTESNLVIDYRLDPGVTSIDFHTLVPEEEVKEPAAAMAPTEPAAAAMAHGAGSPPAPAKTKGYVRLYLQHIVEKMVVLCLNHQGRAIKKISLEPRNPIANIPNETFSINIFTPRGDSIGQFLISQSAPMNIIDLSADTTSDFKEAPVTPPALASTTPRSF